MPSKHRDTKYKMYLYLPNLYQSNYADQQFDFVDISIVNETGILCFFFLGVISRNHVLQPKVML